MANLASPLTLFNKDEMIAYEEGMKMLPSKIFEHARSGGAGNSLYCSVSITDQKALQKLNSPINGQINRRRQSALIAA